MTKEELMKELLTGYDNKNWFEDEEIVEEEY